MLALLVAVTLGFQQPPPAPQDTTKRDTTKVKLVLTALKMDRTVSFETSEGTWALARRVRPTADDRLRAARRSLHDPDWRRRGDADHLRSRPSFPAALVARRQAHRLSPDRSGRRTSGSATRMAHTARRSRRVTNNLYASPDWTPTATTSVVSRTSGVFGERVPSCGDLGRWIGAQPCCGTAPVPSAGPDDTHAPRYR